MKKVLLLLLCLSVSIILTAQVKVIPRDWHLLDYKKDSVYGISLNEAYDLLKNYTPKQKTIVAIIDSGGDINHEDLKDVLWVNPEVTNGEKIKKGDYIGDKHGWNYIGGSDGRTFIAGNSEADREFLNYYKDYLEPDTTAFNRKKMAEYHYFIQSVMPLSKIGATYLGIGKHDWIVNYKDSFCSFMDSHFPDSTFSRATVTKARDLISKLKTLSNKEETAYFYFLQKLFNRKEVKVKDCAALIVKEQDIWRKEAVKKYETALTNGIDVENKRIATGFDLNSKKMIPVYGNSDVTSTVMFHGTHVGGIIGANRENNLGISGIADVQLMFLRVIVEGADETDKDVAMAIRYAVDHGARIINMSFGKSLSPQQHFVNSAITYAEKKGVLLVHAAGNSSQNIDVDKTYPEVFVGKKRLEVNNMLNVGASGPMGKAALFSNYGKNSVHLFAPGVNIFSTVSDNGYTNMSGTSMASPVVSGVAALLLNYFPELSAKELKQILMESGISRNGSNTYLPNKNMFVKVENLKVVDFGSLSRSGKIVNAYQAVKMVIDRLREDLNSN